MLKNFTFFIIQLFSILQRFSHSIIEVQMWHKLSLWVLMVIMILASGCNKEKESTYNRPHDPWVFRSVLDKKPRIITMALHENMWAAYSTKDCALYKVWKGTVFFDGPVYTRAHGPQPMSIGDAWIENKVAKPFVLKSGDEEIQVNAKYKGHRFRNDQVELMYHLSADGLDKPIQVYEKVEYQKSNTGNPVFQRIFTVENAPAGKDVIFRFNASSIAVKENISSNGVLKITSEKSVKQGNINSLEIEAELVLKSTETTTLDIKLLDIPLIKNPNAAGEDNIEDEDAKSMEGARLIAKSDCKTCHNKTVKTIGPAYVAIAERYPPTPENVAMLVSKIKNGGAGAWGQQVMNAHPDLPDTDVEKMVNYILSLHDHSGKEAKSTAQYNFKAVKEDESMVMIPGAVVKVYNIPPTTKKMPVFAPTEKAIHAGILPNFDNLQGSDFKDLKEFFAITASGYLLVEEAGDYILEIWSDDGSKLSLHNKLVIDNDGLHGTGQEECSAYLEKGLHPFFLEYFQGRGGKYLSFNWKRPGQKKFEVIPSDNIYHLLADQPDLNNFSLPMSATSRIPGDKNPLVDVHPAFDLAQARPSDFEPMVGGMDFMSNGDLIVSTWDPGGSVYRLTNMNSADPEKIKVTKIASGLAEPLGLKVVDDQIYVMQKQEMTHLVDSDGDGIIDEYRTLADDWDVSANFHEFGFGLGYKDGFLYAALATAIEPGGASTKPQIKDRGKVIQVNVKTGELRFIATGLRTPNGIGVGYNGELFVADNEGDWLPSSKIVHVQEGAWFGSKSVEPEKYEGRTPPPPMVWLPQDEIGNSPSTPSYINVGPYKGQMIHGEVTHGGVKRVFVEEIDGQLQGCVFRFIQGLEAGINRLVWGPDGSLYVGGIGNPGNWGQPGKKWYGLQKLTFNGKSAFEMLAVRVLTNGVELEFTDALGPNDGWDPKAYEVRQWYYLPTEEYGGPKLNEQKLKVLSSTVSDDRKKVFLEIEGMKEGHVLYVRMDDHFISANGQSLWTTEAWYTVNRIPKDKKGLKKTPPFFMANNTLTPAEQKEGWKLLFDGKSLEHWRNFKKQSLGKSWIIKDDAIHLNSIKKDGSGWQAEDGGDIITKEEYEDFEFKMEWKISACGNSGIMFNVVESDKYNYVWETGPEMQILDNTCHPDTRFPTHRAGDLYDMIACRFTTVKPAGEWNKVMIRSKDGKVDFFLNGHQVVGFEMHTAEWKKMIANSKFKDMPGFGMSKKGHISLQDHGDKVWFRNIKVRKI